MSGRRQQPSQGPSWIKAAATFAAGAVAGAAVAGMAYFAATEEDREAQRVEQQRQQLQRTRRPSEEEEELKVDGVVKVCEICFVHFDDLKAQEVHIMTTPCGHVFCRICIEEALTRKPNCPHCRKHIEINQLQRLFL